MHKMPLEAGKLPSKKFATEGPRSLRFLCGDGRYLTGIWRYLVQPAMGRGMARLEGFLVRA